MVALGCDGSQLGGLPRCAWEGALAPGSPGAPGAAAAQAPLPQRGAEVPAPPLPAGAAADIFTKTKMCKFYLLGICSKGEECQFAHHREELNPLPDLYRTKLCKTLINTGQCDDPTCKYAHNKEELRTASMPGLRASRQQLQQPQQQRQRQRPQPPMLGGLAPALAPMVPPAALQAWQGHGAPMPDGPPAPCTADALSSRHRRARQPRQHPAGGNTAVGGAAFAGPGAGQHVPVAHCQAVPPQQAGGAETVLGEAMTATAGNVMPCANFGCLVVMQQPQVSDLPGAACNRGAGINGFGEPWIKGFADMLSGGNITVKNTFLDFEPAKPLNGLRMVRTAAGRLDLLAEE